MKISSENLIESKKKPSRGKYIIAAGIIFLCIFAGLIYRAITWEQKADPSSEAKIRKIVANQLDKEPNDLTDEDFAQIYSLPLGHSLLSKFSSFVSYDSIMELSDIIPLERCTNLQSLNLISIKSPVPKWMKILGKCGIIDIKKKADLDLGPIKNLSKLQTLFFVKTQVFDLEPIKGLTNLNVIYFEDIPVSDLAPIKGLTNLQRLQLINVPVSNLEPIKELTNLQTLWLNNSQVSDLEPVKGLINLQILDIRNTQVSDLEPLKELISLEKLIIYGCNNITNQQVENLKKALPSLNIER